MNPADLLYDDTVDCHRQLFATLGNSEEGRRAVIRKVLLIGKINALRTAICRLNGWKPELEPATANENILDHWYRNHPSDWADDRAMNTYLLWHELNDLLINGEHLTPQSLALAMNTPHSSTSRALALPTRNQWKTLLPYIRELGGDENRLWRLWNEAQA